MLDLPVGLIVFAFIVLLLLLGIYLYNKLVKLKTLMHEGWSGIDVQLKKRRNLIPNLVKVVSGYASHENTTLQQVTEARTKANNVNNPKAAGDAESLLSSALANLYAVAEQYPDLKANENYLDLQNELSQIETDIEMARRYYNGAVRDNNIAIESFPSNLVAGYCKFTKGEFFEIQTPQDRELPEVNL